MPSKRIKQINELIKEEVSSIIAKEIELPPSCLVTITKVETSADLKHANIWLSILPTDYQQKGLQFISAQAGNIQRIFNPRLKTRNTPKISFRVDDSAEKAEHINQLLDTLKK
ncbi:MAG: ribosome-binding factor A [Candidatus Kerfeldbacteria bacterium CG08_land_8_20_14_0_20_40_16]|uniref:Ribosome-binding factor A n=1 Tax=Candidatus Kerfeldbacteria bacterium CG08_land_8_20_14_0_20_40_16 TaxID=2014244 RepID=A0A2H0YUN2_9BACT|nr:MAG: ribosome-binding factor A [Candidatus Kerfeldbacteria bacterium CG08_land_8_20_14_0_20_40_16]